MLGSGAGAKGLVSLSSRSLSALSSGRLAVWRLDHLADSIKDADFDCEGLSDPNVSLSSPNEMIDRITPKRRTSFMSLL